MKIRILYDNQAEQGLRSGHGFSALVDDTTLFDTGEDAGALLDNMNALGVKLSRIERVVFSHEDSDHTGGLEILKQFGPVDVIFPCSFSSGLREDMLHANSHAMLRPISSRADIAPGLLVTQELGRMKKEIALVGRTEMGLVVLTGCAHPGLENILQSVSDLGAVHAVIGGFHGFNRLAALRGIPLLVPTHCTSKKAEILERYPSQARTAAVGTEIVL